jgi:hypothetical protein
MAPSLSGNSWRHPADEDVAAAMLVQSRFLPGFPERHAARAATTSPASTDLRDPETKKVRREAGLSPLMIASGVSARRPGHV